MKDPNSLKLAVCNTDIGIYDLYDLCASYISDFFVYIGDLSSSVNFMTSPVVFGTAYLTPFTASRCVAKLSRSPGGGAEINPPPVLGWLRPPPPVRGLTLGLQVRPRK